MPLSVTATIYADDPSVASITDTATTVRRFAIVTLPAEWTATVSSGPLVEGADTYGYEWCLSVRDAAVEEFFEALADVADANGHEFMLDVGSHTLSYTAGDRRWAAEQAALRGVGV